MHSRKVSNACIISVLCRLQILRKISESRGLQLQTSISLNSDIMSFQFSCKYCKICTKFDILKFAQFGQNMQQKSNSHKQRWPLKVSDLDLNLCSSFPLGVVFCRLDSGSRTLHGADVSSGMKPYPKIKIS